MHDPIATLTRRGLIRFGGGLLGLTLGGLERSRATAPGLPDRPAIRSCILVFLYGGPSHLDTFDLKPNAPKEVRGEFGSIATSVPGIRVCEHLPHMARVMDRVAQIRTLTHAASLHDSAAIHALTGRPLDGPDRELLTPQPQFYPSHGSAVTAMRPPGHGPVPYAALPFPFRNVHEVPCQGGGFLGSRFDPLQVEVDPVARRYKSELLTPGDTAIRLDSRKALLASIDHTPPGPLREQRERAYSLLDSDALRKAIDITREPWAVRERYGFGAESVAVGEGGGGGNGSEMGYARHMRGQNLLLARRLVEAGVPFVNVYDFKQQGQNWDAHFKCANQHKTHLLPQFDRGLSALIEDLDQRGLMETTLVVAMGEFGRTPKINGEGGRDHWPHCYTVLLAGGGVSGGAVYGASDRVGAYPAIDPVTPGDLAATIFWRFGLDPAAEIRDQGGRPHRLAGGEPVRRLFA
jgi:hypothetical protein